MRLPRNAKIFRGQLEFAPLAGVLFLLLIFLLLGSLMSPPGIRIQIATDKDVAGFDNTKIITVTRQGDTIFEGETNKLEDLEKLRLQLKKLPSDVRVVLKPDPKAPKGIVAQIRQYLDSIQLPVAQNFSGTDNATLIVAVNLGEQFIFDNELVPEDQLEGKLRAAIGKTKETFTLVVLADVLTTDQTIVKLTEIAHAVGIKEIMLATQPGQTRSAKKP